MKMQEKWRYMAMRNGIYLSLIIGFILWIMSEFGSRHSDAGLIVSSYLFFYFSSLLYYHHSQKSKKE